MDLVVFWCLCRVSTTKQQSTNNPFFKPRGWISGIGWMLVAHQTTKTHTHTGWELGRLEHEEHKIYNTKQKQAIIDKREHPTKP